jgi:hypothetical protein
MTSLSYSRSSKLNKNMKNKRRRVTKWVKSIYLSNRLMLAALKTGKLLGKGSMKLLKAFRSGLAGCHSIFRVTL